MYIDNRKDRNETKLEVIMSFFGKINIFSCQNNLIMNREFK